MIGPKSLIWRLSLQVIKKQVEDGVDRRRVGFVSKGAPARQHSEIQTADGEKVLCPRPTLPSELILTLCRLYIMQHLAVITLPAEAADIAVCS